MEKEENGMRNLLAKDKSGKKALAIGAAALSLGTAATAMAVPSEAYAQALNINYSPWYHKYDLLENVPEETMHINTPNLNDAVMIDNGGCFEWRDWAYWEPELTVDGSQHSGPRCVYYTGPDKQLAGKSFTLKWANAGETSSGQKLDMVIKYTCDSAPTDDGSWGNPNMMRNVMETWTDKVEINSLVGGKVTHLDVSVYYAGTNTLANGTYLAAFTDIDVYNPDVTEAVQITGGALGTAYVGNSDVMIGVDAASGTFYAQTEWGDTSTLRGGMVVPVGSHFSFRYQGSGCGGEMLVSSQSYLVDTRVFLRSGGSDTQLGPNDTFPGSSAQAKSVPVNKEDHSQSRIGTQTAFWKSYKAFDFIPPIGYKIVDVQPDGISNATAVANKTYTFSNIRENHYQNIILQEITPTVDVKKTVDKTQVNLTDTATYTLDMWETTDGAVLKNATIKDTLPAPLTGSMFKTAAAIVKYQGTQIPATVSVSGNTLTVATTQTLMQNEHLTVTIPVTFGTTTMKEIAGTHINTMEGSGTSPGGAVIKKSTTASIEVILPTLSITKSVDKKQIGVTETANYTIELTQTKAGAKAFNASISDALPAGFLAAGAKIDTAKIKFYNNAGSEITGTGTSASLSGDILTLKTQQTLAQNEHIKVVVPVVFGETASMGLIGKTWTNTATGNADNTSNNPIDTAALVGIGPAFAITKNITSPSKIVNAGETHIFEIAATQTKPNTIAYNPVLTDVLPIQLVNAGGKMESNIIVKMNGTDITASSTVTIDNASGTLTVKPNKNMIGSDKLVVLVPVTFADKSTKALNGTDLTNTASVSADNASKVSDTETVTVPAPMLKAVKEQDKDILNTSERLHYKASLTQTTANAIAWNVAVHDKLTDACYGAGAYIDKSTLKLSAGDGTAIDLSSTTVSWVGTADKPQGFDIAVNRDLSFGEYIIAEYDIVAGTKTSRGLQTSGIDNGFYGSASNADNAPLAQKHAEIYTPVLQVKKNAERSIVNTSESNHYTVTVTNTNPEGSVAWNVVVDDTLSSAAVTGGAYILPSSIVVKNAAGATLDNTVVKWTGDEARPTGYSVATNADLAYNTCLTVEYDVIAGETTSTQLISTGIDNTVSAIADNASRSPEAKAHVDLYAPQLEIEKASAEEIVNLSETINYTIKVKQTVEGGIAWNVDVDDSLSAETIEAGAWIDKESMKVMDPKAGDITSQCTITYKGDNASKPTGYKIETPCALSKGDPLVITYTATAGETLDIELIDTKVNNEAKAVADNTPSTDPDDNTVDIYVPAVDMTKTAAVEKANCGDEVDYEITMTQTVPGAIAWDVDYEDIIRDDSAAAGARIMIDTIRIYDAAGNDVTSECRFTPSYVVPDMPAVIEDDDVIGKWNVTDTADEFTFEESHSFIRTFTVPETAENKTERGSWILAEGTGKMTLSFDGAEGDEPRTEEVKILTDADKEKMTFKYDGSVYKKEVPVESADESETADTEEAAADDAANDEEPQPAPQKEEADKNLATSIFIETPVDLKCDETSRMTYKMKFGNDDSLGLFKTDVANEVYGYALPNKASVPADELVELYQPVLNLEKTSDKAVISAGDTVHYELDATQSIEGGVAKNLVFEDSFVFRGPALDCAAINSSIKVAVDGADVPGAKIEISVVSAPDAEDPSSVRYMLSAITDIDIDCTQTATLSYDVLFTDATQYVEPQEIHNAATVDASNAEPAEADNIINLIAPDFAIEKTVNNPMLDAPAPVVFNIHSVQIVPDAIARHTVLSDTLDENGIAFGLSVNHDIKVALNGTDITDTCIVNYKSTGGRDIGFEIMIENDINYGDAIDVSYTCSTENFSTGGKIGKVLNTVSIKSGNMVAARLADCPVNINEPAALLKTGEESNPMAEFIVLMLGFAGAYVGILVGMRRRSNR